jgi:dTDP-4-dehydrorhamnose reductase
LAKVTYPALAILAKWQSSLEAGRPIEAFADLNLAPIPLENVVARIDELIGKCETGVFHLFGECEISYYEFARKYFKFIPNSEFLIKKSYSDN